MSKPERNQYYSPKEFVEAHPEMVRNIHQAYNLSKHRKLNGLEEMGACIKKPGIGVRFNPAKFEEWLTSSAT